MSSETTDDCLAERETLLRELGTLSLLLQGSLFERYSICSRPGCKCHSGERHGPRHYLVINENGQQRQKYVPKAFVGVAKEGLSQHSRLREIVDRITHLNLALMHEEHGYADQ
jgi:hypothetical protein